MLENIRIVLLNTTHPGNIGATARAMKTMGLTNLYLVNPKYFPDEEATARAKNADDILEKVQVFATLDEAIADCALVLGSSARRRSIEIETYSPREAAQWIQTQAQSKPTAILFGRERDGLTNEELDRCQRLITIPTNPDYSSLNIASAVQVIAYELRVASLENVVSPALMSEEEKATGVQLQDLWVHLENTLKDIDFLSPKNPGHTLRKLTRLLQRANMSAVEVQILRGVLSSVQKKNLNK